jgi:hypothetical protein
MNKSKIGVLSIISLLLLLFSLSASLVCAQYSTEKTTNIVIGSDGVFTATESSVGVSYVIEGLPGAVGSATTVVYSGNPQVAADVPEGVFLSHFIAITFDMSADDFTRATITISYNDNELAGLGEPYSVYKYLPGSDSFVALTTAVDTDAKTMTVTLGSVDDPLFAIGGLASEHSILSAGNWLLVSVGTVAFTLLAMAIVILWRKDKD